MNRTETALRFEWSLGLESFEGAHYVRDTVFIREQGFQREFDETDKTAEHLTAFADGGPVAAARLFSEGDSVYHVGRVCVLKSYRGRHYGELLMREVIARASLLGARKVVLGAQMHAVPFYAKLGFEAKGEPFDDEGAPHRYMELLLAE